jgi:hypothetical protein
VSKILICSKKENYVIKEEKYGGLELERAGHGESLSKLVVATLVPARDLFVTC